MVTGPNHSGACGSPFERATPTPSTAASGVARRTFWWIGGRCASPELGSIV